MRKEGKSRSWLQVSKVSNISQIFFLFIFLLTFFFSSFDYGSENAVIEQKLFKPETNRATNLSTSFDVSTFFKNYDPAVDSEDYNQKENDDQKLRELGFSPEELSGKRAEILKRGPFDFMFFEKRIYLVDQNSPTKAIKLEGPIGFLETKGPGVKRNFANEVDGIEVEQMNGDIYRIFAQLFTGNGKQGTSPMTGVWDYDKKTNAVTYYGFGTSFAKDVEKKGHRDLVVCDKSFDKDHWDFTAKVFSWDGKEWVDISDKEKDFLRDLSKKGY
jgi:hypothetical protein